MNNTGYIALSRQTTLMRQMDVVANNIANANTTAYKGEHVLFKEYLTQRSADLPMSYVEDIAVKRDTQQGNLLPTENALDIAIQGDGYVVVDTPAGPRYSRGGTFQLDADRRIVTTQGYPLNGDNDQPITVGDANARITISREGTVLANERPVGKIRLVSFENEQQLRKTAGGLYTTDAEPQPVAKPLVLQGMIEQSNVQPIVEMTRMMDVLRSFQANQKMVEGEHERQLKAIREIPNLQSS